MLIVGCHPLGQDGLGTMINPLHGVQGDRERIKIEIQFPWWNTDMRIDLREEDKHNANKNQPRLR